jgi:flagellar biosynthesis component FlhA
VAVPELWSLGCFEAMNTQKVKIKWLFISVAAVVLLVGSFYAVADRSLPAFLFALFLAAGIALSFIIAPIVFVMLCTLGSKIFGAIFVRSAPRKK